MRESNPYICSEGQLMGNKIVFKDLFGIKFMQGDTFPVLKWAGGKRQLLCKIEQMMPNNYNVYYEPFFGGGAVYFKIKPDRAVINDLNKQLMLMYCQIKDNPDDMCKFLENIQEEYNSLPTIENKVGMFYRLRDKFNSSIKNLTNDTETASLFIFLNKACYNSLYRVNSSGEFNVPPNRKDKIVIYDKNNIEQVSKLLSGAKILCGDFKDSLIDAKEGDFVFLDSPYYGTFDTYQKNGFSEQDHIRLFNEFKRLSNIGAKCLLTNNDCDFIKDMYSEYNIERIDVKRLINSDGSNRVGKEVIITNYTN